MKTTVAVPLLRKIRRRRLFASLLAADAIVVAVVCFAAARSAVLPVAADSAAAAAGDVGGDGGEESIATSSSRPLSCSLTTLTASGGDPADDSVDNVDKAFAARSHLEEMEYDVGNGPRRTKVYVEPEVGTFYNGGGDDTATTTTTKENDDNDNAAATTTKTMKKTTTTRSRTKVVPKFTGFSGKFVNMSDKRVTFYWYVYVFVFSCRNRLSARCLFLYRGRAAATDSAFSREISLAAFFFCTGSCACLALSVVVVVVERALVIAPQLFVRVLFLLARPIGKSARADPSTK